jgi:hypothetical protein
MIPFSFFTSFSLVQCDPSLNYAASLNLWQGHNDLKFMNLIRYITHALAVNNKPLFKGYIIAAQLVTRLVFTIKAGECQIFSAQLFKAPHHD